MKLVAIIAVSVCIIAIIAIFISKNKFKEAASPSVAGLDVREVNPNKVRAIRLKQAILDDDIAEIKKVLGSVKYSAAGVWEEAKSLGMQPSQLKPEIVVLLVEAGVPPENFKENVTPAQALPEDLNAALLAALEEPNNWEDDEIHAVNWAQMLQLLNAGANVTQQDAQGRSVWARVITAPIPNEPGTDITKELLQRAEIVEKLLQKGVSVEEPIDENGNTALMQASSEGQLPVVEVLLKHNANINAVNNNGNTALMLAVGPHYASEPGYPPTITVSYDNHAQIVQALLQAGADVAIKNKAGKTALLLAQDTHEEINKDDFYQVVRSATEDESRKEIISLLKSAGAKEM